jgi:hypothetical protein
LGQSFAVWPQGLAQGRQVEGHQLARCAGGGGAAQNLIAGRLLDHSRVELGLARPGRGPGPVIGGEAREEAYPEGLLARGGQLQASLRCPGHCQSRQGRGDG